MSTSKALIKDLEGEVSVTRNGEVVNIKVGDYLLPGDEVVTGDAGRLGLEFPGIEGQEPAAGVMTPNGKIVLGEQDSPNGPQMLVMEETECFEFTTEITELSSVAQDSGASGLFGGLAAGGGMIAAGVGAVAAGLFAGGGGGGSSDEDISMGGTSGNAVSEGPLAPVAGEGTPVGGAVAEVVDPNSLVGAVIYPVTKPVTEATGIDTTGSASNGSTGNTTSGSTGNASDSPINQIINPINESPLGVVTQPVTDAIVGQLPEGTGPGADTVPGSSAGTSPADPGPDHIVEAVQETVTGLQEDPSSTNPEGTVQNLVEAVQQDLTELGSAGETNPIGTLVDTVVDGVNQTPLGEPLSPVTEQVQALTDTFDLNSLINAGTDAGLVTTVVDTVGGALEPVTTQVEPLASVVDVLHDTAVTVDSVLADTLGSVEGLFSGADVLGGGADSLSADSLSPDTLTAALSDLPATLEEATGGLLGTVESLAAQLPSGGAEDPTGGLLDTAVSTISSTASDPASSDLTSALNNVLNGLG